MISNCNGKEKESTKNLLIYSEELKTQKVCKLKLCLFMGDYLIQKRKINKLSILFLLELLTLNTISRQLTQLFLQ